MTMDQIWIRITWPSGLWYCNFSPTSTKIFIQRKISQAVLQGIESVTVSTCSDYKRLSDLSELQKSLFTPLGNLVIMRYIRYFIYWLGWLNTVSHYYWIKDGREQDTKQTLSYRFHFFLTPRINKFQSKLPSHLPTEHLKLGGVLLLPSAHQIPFCLQKLFWFCLQSCITSLWCHFVISSYQYLVPLADSVIW